MSRMEHAPTGDEAQGRMIRTESRAVWAARDTPLPTERVPGQIYVPSPIRRYRDTCSGPVVGQVAA